MQRLWIVALRRRPSAAMKPTITMKSCISTSHKCSTLSISPTYTRQFTSVPTSENLKKPGTVLMDEVEKFEKIASNWWSLSGEFKALHAMNRLRVPLIRDGLLNNKQIESADVEFPLESLSILDVGCGGGILSLPLGRLGAKVIAIDAGHENIERAKAELNSSSSTSSLSNKVQFINTTLEDYHNHNDNQFDAVVISEVLDHVPNPSYFIELAAQFVKPNGSMFITTISRTTLSWLGAIIAGEYILGVLPRGTHDWKLFVTPEEAQIMLHQNGFSTRLLHGMNYNAVTNTWEWSRCTDINYALHAVKKSEL